MLLNNIDSGAFLIEFPVCSTSFTSRKRFSLFSSVKTTTFSGRNEAGPSVIGTSHHAIQTQNLFLYSLMWLHFLDKLKNMFPIWLQKFQNFWEDCGLIIRFNLTFLFRLIEQLLQIINFTEHWFILNFFNTVFVAILTSILFGMSVIHCLPNLWKIHTVTTRPLLFPVSSTFVDNCSLEGFESISFTRSRCDPARFLFSTIPLILIVFGMYNNKVFFSQMQKSSRWFH